MQKLPHFIHAIPLLLVPLLLVSPPSRAAAIGTAAVASEAVEEALKQVAPDAGKATADTPTPALGVSRVPLASVAAEAPVDVKPAAAEVAPAPVEQSIEQPVTEPAAIVASEGPAAASPAPAADEATGAGQAGRAQVKPPVEQKNPQPVAAPATAPVEDVPADAPEPAAPTESTPAPIVESSPTQRAENVDLREVVTPTPAASSAQPPIVESATPVTAGEVLVEGTPLILLGTEVLPSTSARLAWSPTESFAGIAAPTPVLVINGAKPGPVLCLTAAIHGDELVGIEVVRRVLYSVDAKQLSGALIGVPIVNLQGFRRSSRYLPDRRDLNRFFPGNTHGSSAARIAHSFFNEVVLKCDALVDLHTGSFHRTNLPQVRGDLNNPDVASLAKGFGATVVLQSRGSRGMLRRAAVDVGIPAVTLEAGEPLRLDEQPVVQGVRSIEHLLDSLGMLPMRGRFARREQPVFYKSTWVRANEGGVLSSKVKLGQTVKVGDLLGTVIDPITNAQHDIVSPHAGRIIGMALNQVMMPGFAAYHIGIQSTVEEAATPDPTLDTAVDELDDEDAGPIPEAAAPSGAPSAAPAERVPDDTE